MTSEFNLIKKYFTRSTRHADLGVGDDAALVRVSDGMQLVVSTDMSVAGTHFFHDCAPYDIGWKALAVNVSDMAAMGAQAKWATLALALPEINEDWLAEFSRGFFACADEFNIDLIGGDTTKGPLNISVTIMGEVPAGEAIKRTGAQVGDDIWVSGTLGDAALALAIQQKRFVIDKNWLEDELDKWLPCLNRPQPRASLGLALQGIATSCIDVSDGLLADLGHILTASNLGAEVHLERIPVSLYNLNHLHEAAIQKCVLAGGDDYELCFTAPPSKREQIELIGKQQNLLLTCIASTRMDIGLQAIYKNTALKLNNKGFDHFGKNNE
jgi:thiamine-monophosphate kinase